MAHLYKLGLENFRVFKEYTEIECAPITILTGANNSGKSSVIKAIQLLKNNLANNNSDSDLSLSFISGEHNLSNFNDIVNDPAKPLKFVLPTVLKGNDEILSITLSYIHNKNNELGEGIISCIELHNNKKELIFKYDVIDSEPNVYSDFKYFYKKFVELINFLKKCRLVENDYETKSGKVPWRDHPINDLSVDNMIKIKDIGRKINFYQYPLISNYRPNAFLKADDLDSKITSLKTSKSDLLDPELLLLLFISLGDIDLNLWKESYSEAYFEKHDKEEIIYSYLRLENHLTTEEINKIKKTFKNTLLDKFNLFKPGIADDYPFRSQFNLLITHFYHLRMLLIGDLLQTVFQKVPIEKRENLVSGLYSKDKDETNNSISNLEFFLQDYISKNISQLLINTGKYFKSVAKIDSVRANTQRLYTYNSQGTAFNALLLKALKRNICKETDKKTFLNKWLNKFGIKGKLNISNSQPGVGITVSIGDRPLADLGYGITQLLAILLEITLIGNENYWDEANYDPDSGYHHSSTLIIEEPETNLHPKYQSLLADLFVEASKKYRIQFIIETHSEYLIRKLQFLTGKGDIKPADTSLYYFYSFKEKPKGEKQVKKIEIMQDGRLSDYFGEGFFDEADNLAMKLFVLNKNTSN